MLAAAAVSGAGQKLDARPAFQDDLLPPDGRFDLGHMAPQLGALKEIAHLLKRLSSRFLEVRGV